MSTNKSAGFDTGFMSHLDQKPVRTRKKKHKVNKTKRVFKFPSFPKFPKLIKPRQKQPLHEEIQKQPKKSGFSFPVPSLPTLAVAAGIVVIAFAALHWEEINIRIPERYILQPAADEEIGRHTMQYAATGRTNIMPAQASVIEHEGTGEAESGGQAAVDEVFITDGSIITFKWEPYRVKRGDSVSAIAQEFGVSVGAIIASNDIRNARTLQEGAVLRIPNIDGIPYQIKSGDSYSRIAASFNIPLEVILDVNDIKSDNIVAGETIFIPGARMNDIDLRLSLGELFIYPVASRFVTSRYGWRRDPMNGELSFHTGIDLRADTGTTVMAALDGVISVVSENWLYGKYIIISHDNGYKTLYAHLNSYSVRQGDRVARGRKIGEAGNTGYSTGPHLHFSIYDKNGRLVNPLELIR